MSGVTLIPGDGTGSSSPTRGLLGTAAGVATIEEPAAVAAPT